MALAQRILKNQRESEDLLHDVFVEVWRRAGDYDPSRGSVGTWLRLRTRSRALDRVRSARIARAEPLEQQGDKRTPDSGRAVEQSADHVQLREALVALPDEQRTVLLLGYFEGLSSSGGSPSGWGSRSAPSSPAWPRPWPSCGHALRRTRREAAP